MATIGCAGEADGETVAGDSATTSGSGVQSGSSAGTTASSGGATPTDGPAPDDGQSSGTGDGVCHVADAESARFDVRHGGAPLPPTDAVLRVECGWQGSFMFYFPVEIYGLDTMGDGYVPFRVTLDIDGFNDIGANGHFASVVLDAYVGCRELEGGDAGQYLAVVLPDAITDPHLLDSLAFALEITMAPGSAGEHVVQSTGVVSVANEPGWGWCLGCDEFATECPEGTTGTTGPGSGSDGGSDSTTSSGTSTSG